MAASGLAQCRLDQIVGVLHAKDLLTACFGDATTGVPAGTDEPGALTLAALARPAAFVLERSHLSDVLTTFRNERAHLALVSDEYGQVVGLLTLEDVLEELVGEIQDEYDVGEEAPIIQRGDGSWLVLGTETCGHVREAVGLPPIPPAERGQYATLPGLVTLRLGRLPRVGDRTPIGEGWEVEVAAMKERRVNRVLLRRQER
jgi:putative hemolysin